MRGVKEISGVKDRQRERERERERDGIGINQMIDMGGKKRGKEQTPRRRMQ